jgi:hypothetical protein
LHSGSGAPLFKREETRLAAVKAGVLKMTLVGLVDRTMVSIAIVRQNEKCRCGQKSGSWCRDDGVEAHHWLRISSIGIGLTAPLVSTKQAAIG